MRRTISASQWKRLLAIAAGALSISVTVGVSAAKAEGEAIASGTSEISVYSETSQANQVGQGYLIFEERGETLIGAFYYPQSEYSCFTGQKNGQTLEILSLPSYQEPMSNFSLSLDQMQSVRQISGAEKQVLSACRQDVVAFLNQRQTAMDLSNVQAAN